MYLLWLSFRWVKSACLCLVFARAKGSCVLMALPKTGSSSIEYVLNSYFGSSRAYFLITDLLLEFRSDPNRPVIASISSVDRFFLKKNVWTKTHTLIKPDHNLNAGRWYVISRLESDEFVSSWISHVARTPWHRDFLELPERRKELTERVRSETKSWNSLINSTGVSSRNIYVFNGASAFGPIYSDLGIDKAFALDAERTIKKKFPNHFKSQLK